MKHRLLLLFLLLTSICSQSQAFESKIFRRTIYYDWTKDNGFEIGPNRPVSVQMIPLGTYLLKLDDEKSQKFIRN